MLNADQLRRIVRARTIPLYAEPLAKAAFKHMPDYGITTPEDVAAAWATFATETGRFRKLEENLNYSAKRLRQVWPSRFRSNATAKAYARNPQKLANKVYGSRLGNRGKANAGWLYRGSGPIQTTGYNNFLQIEEITGIKVTKNPDILRQDPDRGMLAACIYWKHRKCSAAANRGDLKAVRKLVNGGTHGLAEFQKYYQRALSIIKREGFSTPGGGPTKPRQKTTKANPRSRILPLYRPKQADRVTHAVLEEFADLMPEKRRGDKVKVLFVRGYYLNSMGRKGKNDRALYDDAVFVVSPEGVQSFNGNSDPSVFRKRVASIKSKQAIRYKPGPHGYNRRGGPYPAFRQDEKCTVIRDGEGPDTGMFAVNLHRGGVNGTSSLGCLTIPPHQWNEFYGLLKSLLEKHRQETFFVTLLEYAGDHPPIDVSKTLPSTSKPVSKNPAIGIAIVSIGALIASWWDRATSWIGGLF